MSDKHTVSNTSFAYEGITITVTAEITKGNDNYESELDSDEAFERIAKQWRINLMLRDKDGMSTTLEWLHDCLKAVVDPLNKEIDHLVPKAKEEDNA